VAAGADADPGLGPRFAGASKSSGNLTQRSQRRPAWSAAAARPQCGLRRVRPTSARPDPRMNWSRRSRMGRGRSSARPDRDDDPAKGIEAQRPWCPYPATTAYSERGDRSQYARTGIKIRGVPL
jgi:hypothetical protein